MNVGKWGNSLAVRLPKDVVEALGLKEGDEIKITAKKPRRLEIERDRTREEALEKVRALQRPLPASYRFDRDEVHER
jgi:antitoxin MazE